MTMETSGNLYPAVNVADYPAWLRTLINCKERFLYHNEDPRNMTCLRNYVAESWFRSRQYGIDPFAKTVGTRCLHSDIQSIVDRNRELIQLTRSLIAPLKTMLQQFGYVFALTDHNGVFLHLDGPGAAIGYFKEINARVGAIWREDTTGTTAHALSLLYKCPILLLGPEHYCLIFQNTISASAPIFDENEQLVGTLTVAKPLQNASWESCYEMVQNHIHTLYLVIAMARAIESQNRLRKRQAYFNFTNNHLLKADKIVKSVIATIEDGCLVLDANGRICHINDQGAKMFKINAKDCRERHLAELLPKNSSILKAFSSGKPVNHTEETFTVGNETRTYTSCLVPIRNENRLEGAILRIRQPDTRGNRQSLAKFTFNDLIGNSAAFQSAKKLAQRFARAKEPILLLGESGTGKELFAQAIHNAYCPEGPFIVINCAGIPRELMESEFFGYEGGSFTGADREGRPGKIELAHGGTLFLDEIGDMPPELQAVLLRALEYKQVMRVGGRTYKQVDFRLISATNKNLVEMVEKKRFREDLFFRISVLTISIPPLRERGDDLNLLADYFLQKGCQALGRQPVRLSSAARRKINEYTWPGNVRQLENALLHALILAQKDVIELEDLPGYILTEDLSPHEPGSRKEVQMPPGPENASIDDLEREAIQKVLAKTKYHVPKAAGLLGISKSTLYRKLKKYKIEY